MAKSGCMTYILVGVAGLIVLGSILPEAPKTSDVSNTPASTEFDATNYQLASGEIEIPRSYPENARYILLDVKKKNESVYEVITKRVGKPFDGDTGLGFTRQEINCKKRVYRVMGTSYDTLDPMTINPTKWTELVSGSSKSDTVNFVCSWY